MKFDYVPIYFAVIMMVNPLSHLSLVLTSGSIQLPVLATDGIVTTSGYV
jgi:hypothetical protein